MREEWTSSHIDTNLNSELRGGIHIDCKGSDGAGWHAVNQEKFSKYKVGQPRGLDTAQFNQVLRTTVTCESASYQVAVDGNRDGKISFGMEDETTAKKPYRFWINDDIDRGNSVDLDESKEGDWEEDDLLRDPSALFPEEKDCEDKRLKVERDLEDLARLSINFTDFDRGG